VNTSEDDNSGMTRMRDACGFTSITMPKFSFKILQTLSKLDTSNEKQHGWVV
jgi:hypothetical protein